MEELQARLDKAIINAYDVGDLVRNGKSVGENPVNVFDFTDGLKLIISSEYHNGQTFIHYSASIADDYIKNFDMKNPRDFVKIAEKRFKELSGNKYPEFKMCGFSQAGIPHWVLEL